MLFKVQNEDTRDEDLESKAYRRYLRSPEKDWNKRVSETLEVNSKR